MGCCESKREVHELNTMESQVATRIATVDDWDLLHHAFASHCEKMGWDFTKNFEPVVREILKSDTKEGFCIMATRDAKVCGFLIVTYEWSDWRNGVMLWFQAVEAQDQETANSLRDKLLEISKSGELKYQVTGIRLSSLKSMADKCDLIVKLFDLQKTHYYIYTTDTASSE